MKIAQTSLLFFLVALLAACSGRYFVRPPEGLIKLGKTTEDEVIAAMGDPLKSEWGERLGKKIKMIGYIYVIVPHREAISRAVFFYFVDGVLVGHYFCSEFAGESTDFDLTRIGNIVENQSTRRDVEAALGKPSGEAIYPMLDDPEGRMLEYRYYGERFSKEAFFEIDKDGIVRHFTVEVTPEN